MRVLFIRLVVQKLWENAHNELEDISRQHLKKNMNKKKMLTFAKPPLPHASKHTTNLVKGDCPIAQPIA